MSNPIEFTRVRLVTRPVLQIKDKPVIFKVEAAIHLAPKTEGGREQKDAAGNTLPPPSLMNVINMHTGEEAVVVVNTVLGKNLTETYPDDSYVNRIFEVGKFAPKDGKRYATFQIAELAIKTPEAVKVAAQPDTARKGGK